MTRPRPYREGPHPERGSSTGTTAFGGADHSVSAATLIGWRGARSISDGAGGLDDPHRIAARRSVRHPPSLVEGGRCAGPRCHAGRRGPRGRVLARTGSAVRPRARPRGRAGGRPGTTAPAQGGGGLARRRPRGRQLTNRTGYRGRRDTPPPVRRDPVIGSVLTVTVAPVNASPVALTPWLPRPIQEVR